MRLIIRRNQFLNLLQLIHAHFREELGNLNLLLPAPYFLQRVVGAVVQQVIGGPFKNIIGCTVK